ncbi:protein of unknown function [Lactiplantibacillus plantarum]
MFALSIYTYNLDLLPFIVNSFLLSFYFSIIKRTIYCYHVFSQHQLSL